MAWHFEEHFWRNAFYLVAHFVEVDGGNEIRSIKIPTRLQLGYHWQCCGPSVVHFGGRKDWKGSISAVIKSKYISYIVCHMMNYIYIRFIFWSNPSDPICMNPRGVSLRIVECNTTYLPQGHKEAEWLSLDQKSQVHLSQFIWWCLCLRVCRFPLFVNFKWFKYREKNLTLYWTVAALI